MTEMPSRNTDTDDPATAAARAQRYWRSTTVLTAALLTLWLGVTLAASFFARELQGTVAGWPMAFWLGAQGALLVFLAIVWAYAWCMERFDRDAL